MQMAASSSSSEATQPRLLNFMPPYTPAQIKRRLWANKTTLKQWALDNNYAYSTVSAVMSGKIKVTMNYGKGYEIAIRLGLVVETVDGELIRAKAPL
jgi:gp16 family phage-associated protein